ncbi:hypothetical protein AAC03nite_20060 [Alicyclobacillus acidoterrestris]|nr:hypothetical protein AAC03nite_20060 [Alicyclobacillus acidoterrestris]
MPDLFPTFTLPTVVVNTSAPDPTYNGSFLFDFETGEFVTDGAGRVVIGDGYQAWVQWCVKSCLTERMAYLAYDSDIGVELEQKQPTRDLWQSQFELTVTEALTTDPRTQSVTGFSYTWNGDQVTASFTVTPVVGTPQEVEVTIGG